MAKPVRRKPAMKKAAAQKKPGAARQRQHDKTSAANAPKQSASTIDAVWPQVTDEMTRSMRIIEEQFKDNEANETEVEAALYNFEPLFFELANNVYRAALYAFHRRLRVLQRASAV